MASRLCGTCEQPIQGDDYALCEGICGRSFHGTIKCSTVRNEIVRQIRRGGNLKFVCGDCQNVSLLHVMTTLKICNDHVLSLHEKIDDMTAASNNIFRRLSTLETSVNDVNEMETSRLCDDIGQRNDRGSKNLLLKLNVMESRLMGFINEKFEERCPNQGAPGGNVLSQSCQTDFPESVSKDVNVVGLSLDSSAADEMSEEEYVSDSDSYSADLSDNDDDDDECIVANDLVFTNTLLKLRRDDDFASFHLRSTSTSLATRTFAGSCSNRERRVHFDESTVRDLTGLTETQRNLLMMAQGDQTIHDNPRNSERLNGHHSRSGDGRQFDDRSRKRWLRVAGLYNGTTANSLRDYVSRTLKCNDVECAPLYGNTNPYSLPWLSFKVGVPSGFFQASLSKEIWPSQVTVREFTETPVFRHGKPYSRAKAL